MDDKQGNSEKQAPQSEARETSAPPPSNNSSTGAPAPYNYSSPKPKSGKKVLIWVFSILAVLLLLLGGASVLAYNFWYQNPEKVILESVVNGFAADTVKVNSESTFEIKGWDNEQASIKFNKLRFNTAAHQKNAFGTYETQLDGVVDLKTYGSVKSSVPFTLSAKAMIAEDGGKVFVKVDKVEPLYDAIKKVVKHYEKDSESFLTNGFFEKNDAAVRKIIKKFDDQWISFSGDFSTPEKFYSCIRDNYGKLSDEQKNSEKKIVADIYQNHKFIKIGDYLGSKNGSLGYKYSIDAKKLAEFLQDLSKNKATISGISAACLDDSEYGSGKDKKDNNRYEGYYNNKKSDEELRKEKIDQFTEKFEKIEGELWTTRFGHKITSGKTTVVMKNVGDSERVTVSTSYESTIDGEVKASRPENAKDAAKLWEEVQNDFKSLMKDQEDSLTHGNDDYYDYDY